MTGLHDILQEIAANTGNQATVEARDGEVGAVMAAAVNMEWKTLERRRAYHLDIT